ncbi:MAG: tryptophan synthase subunit alpha [Verrucomicrobia bacterium]|nr:tryptophan synthase subunit alpha [Verrucomicrobiota bacterium]MBV9129204.1 tryptophan synthase subunit alpha [Verrucomicrobiota bacterium]MBV9644012.1 tryptophan synthase subunit alpha [Verrucomicrobiota bacterium]
MDNRIDARFSALRSEGASGFMAYITGGDPTPERTLDIALALSKAGVDFLEIGIPFSDPLADGVANQLGAQRALAAGVTVPKLLKTIIEIRKYLDFPIILYSYLNPLFQYGFERFERDAAAAGADGLLLLDLPPDETLLPDNQAKLLHRIRLVAPTTSKERIEQIVSRADGFIYYVSQEGVTGERETLSQTISEHVAMIRRETDLPVAVGFGISNAAQAGLVASFADAVVVGSAIVRRIGEFGQDEQLPLRIQEFVDPLVRAVKSGRRNGTQIAKAGPRL